MQIRCKFKLMVFIILVATSLITSGCTEKDEINNDDNISNNKINIYTSLYVLEEFSQKIGGEYVNVVNLIPRGASPHDYDPSAKDIISIMDSDIFVYNGAGLELWLDKVIDNLDNTNVEIVNACNGLELLVGVYSHNNNVNKNTENFVKENNYDPHVWLDPLNALKQAEAIEQALILVDPDHEQAFIDNFQKLKEELEDLNRKYSDELVNLKHNEFFVSHAAFGYLANRYGIEQYSISGIILQDEPSPKELANIVSEANNLNIGYILLDPKDEIKIATVVAEEIGAKTECLYNISSPSKEELNSGLDYISMMERNLEVLKLALNE